MVSLEEREKQKRNEKKNGSETKRLQHKLGLGKFLTKKKICEAFGFYV